MLDWTHCVLRKHSQHHWTVDKVKMFSFFGGPSLVSLCRLVGSDSCLFGDRSGAQFGVFLVVVHPPYMLCFSAQLGCEVVTVDFLSAWTGVANLAFSCGYSKMFVPSELLLTGSFFFSFSFFSNILCQLFFLNSVLILLRVLGKVGVNPSWSGREARCTLERSPIYDRADTETENHSLSHSHLCAV